MAQVNLRTCDCCCTTLPAAMMQPVLYRPDQLPELVRDSRLSATIDPEKNLTIHARPFARRASSRLETWLRKQLLGHGGYGVVWLEQKVGDDSGQPHELRAVKSIRIPKNQTISQLHGGRYVRELEALAKFSQDAYTEFFVKLYGWYESAGSLNIAMEYCKEGDLNTYLENVGTLPESQVQEIASQILGALTLMHGTGFAHRDLKPAVSDIIMENETGDACVKSANLNGTQNILIKTKPPEDSWWVKLCDFGLSKRSDAVVFAHSTVRGTPEFMPPETIGWPFLGAPSMANPYSADMWCFGETLFRCSTGHAVFEDRSQLHRYQRYETLFPFHELERVKASFLATNFIYSLMLPHPGHRLHTQNAGRHGWMYPMTHDSPVGVPAGPGTISNSVSQQPAGATINMHLRVPVSGLGNINQLTEASGVWSTTVTQSPGPPLPTLDRFPAGGWGANVVETEDSQSKEPYTSPSTKPKKSAKRLSLGRQRFPLAVDDRARAGQLIRRREARGGGRRNVGPSTIIISHTQYSSSFRISLTTSSVYMRLCDGQNLKIWEGR